MTEGDSRAGVYVWAPPERGASIHLKLDVVDAMLQDVMRGFGAVPRRGAEVGGILLGEARRNGELAVRVDDFELVPIEYKHGPSYLPSAADIQSFSQAFERLQAGAERGHPVGFFRSHTRDAAGLGAEDLELLARFFPGPDTVVLLIRPFAAKPSVGGFYVKEDGAFAQGPPALEFPFRRKELAFGEGDAARNRPADGSEDARGAERLAPRTLPSALAPPNKLRRDLARTTEPPAGPPLIPRAPLDARPEPALAPPEAAARPSSGKARGRSWIWLPISLLCLVLGVFLGFQAAFNLRPPAQPPASDLFAMGLTVQKTGDNLHVKWDRQASAIRAAQRGVLTIDDGAFTKTLDLDPGQLQNGSVVYKHYSSDVRFRLQVFPTARDSLMETVQWKP